MTLPRSWTLPSPCLFTASDPHAADGRNVPTVLQIIGGPSVRPDRITTAGPPGVVYQAEGPVQAAAAARRIAADGGAGNRAIVSGLGIDPAPFIALGVTSVMVECYAQAGDQPYGNLPRMLWQAKHEGWPHAIPVLGVFDNVDLEHYIELNGGPANFKGGHWRGCPLAIYLAEGMTDTGSWPSLAAL